MKITNKQLQGYKRAKREWLSANEEYNKSVYGITTPIYRAIKQAEQGINGIIGTQQLTLSKMNKALQYIK